MRFKHLFVLLCVAAGCAMPVAAQSFVETGAQYPLSAESDKYAVTGFVNVGAADETIYANALLWTIENVCPRLTEGIVDNSVADKRFSCDLVLSSLADSESKAIYYCRAIFQAAGGKLVYHISNIRIESQAYIIKKVTPMEKLSPQKKESHQQLMDDFVKSESLLLNRLFDFVTTYQSPAPITHWKEISIRKPVQGMTEDECRLAFGKPQAVTESNGEVQWMYSTSFYLFFKNGRVETIIK